ncbi:cell wall-binding repeat-containing protein [Clostridium cochlearium]|uniref:cell wall-binding repeat-containing protein n=1 Tax=Clostridium cochlearium TaxID=1494 RepID=UPI00156D5279|nr:cell wall-binding repeat-containing protein [Clostridium cochlearium]MBV1820156.1 cell wall-binding repeat-containing protein [Bacteroidales bacterium MSK.15.36]MCG4579967.1 cell wall-binding repeat-containing protein [Clostridium cochlearium]NSJ90856.1 cell wall-binding repeat-containing protein [Coprococcus sp. MSK.21.13]
MNKKLLSKVALTLLTTTVCTLTLATNAFAKNEHKRIYGQNRIETSIKISEEGWKDGSKVAVIAQGYNYADALCVSPLAKKYNAPIILTASSKLDKNAIKELKRLNVNRVFITGGKAVVSEEIEKQLKSLNIKDIKRLYGQNRYETSLEVAKELGDSKEVFITSGNGYADSLSVAPIAAKKGAPILFADKSSLKDSVKKYIDTINPNKIYIIGGQGVITDNAVKGIKNPERISGKDRFETNKNVLSRFKNELKFDNIYVVQGAGPKGNEFADALSCSALAAQEDAPVVLTYNGINQNLKNFVKENLKDSSKLIAIGGEKIVPSSILEQLNKKSTEKDNSSSSSSSSSGGSSGGSSHKSKDIKINKDNEVYGEEGEKIKVIDGNVSVKANNVTLQNLDVRGVVTLDPGKEGIANLKNVKAETIKVKSGGENSIYLIKTKSKDLLLDSISKVRIELTEDSSMDTTIVRTSSILDDIKGTFGNVIIEKSYESTKNKEIEFKGKFDKAIIVKDKANITLNGEISEVKIFDESKINVEKGSKVDVIASAVKSEIEVGEGSIVNNIKKAVEDVKIIGDEKDIKDIKIEKVKLDDIKPDVEPDEKPQLKEIIKVEGDVALKIIKTKDGSIDIKVSSEKYFDEEVTIKLLDEKNNIRYLGQATLNNGKVNFSTKLENGKYYGYYRTNGVGKVEILAFTIK